MSKTIIAKPGFNYLARKFTTKDLKKGTKVILPKGFAADIYQDGRKLLSINEEKTFKLSKKDVPGLKSKLFSKDLDKIELYCYDKNPVPFVYKMYYHRPSESHIADAGDKKGSLASLKCSLGFKLTMSISSLTDKPYFLFKGRKVDENGNLVKRWQFKNVLCSYFDKWLAKNIEFAFDYKSASDLEGFVLEKTSDANEEHFADLAKAIGDNITSGTGYDSKVECLGAFE